MLFTIYILRTSSNTLYIGQTNNLEKRLAEHKNKTSKSAKYIKYFDSCQLVYSEGYLSRIEAMRREYQLKHWTKAEKEALIKGDLSLLSHNTEQLAARSQYSVTRTFVKRYPAALLRGSSLKKL